jgi:tetratricopeptide (TPR) repeat protein
MSPPVTRLHLVLGDDARRVDEEVHRIARALAQTHGVTESSLPSAAEWPWQWPRPSLGPGRVLTVADLHLAVDTAQTGSTRLITTQLPFLLAEWMRHSNDDRPSTVVAGGHRATLEAHTPELVRRRGIFSRADVTCLDRHATDVWPPPQTRIPLAEAMSAPTADARLQALVACLAEGRTPPRLVAVASACQEVNDLDSAARDLDDACGQAPDWAAAWFERGKVWLRCDDMAQAARCFAEATRCLPEFSGAWGNLGAALGELDRTAEAFEAFTHLLHLDPQNPQAHNNIGVVTRELGRLSESEGAFRTVTNLDPDRPYGYYNLGHTLFLQGRFRASVAAYEAGQGRDPERNPVQATRLGLALLAAGDPIAGFHQIQTAAARLSGPYREQVLADTSGILWALISQQPGLTGWEPLQQWLQRQLPARHT